MLETVYLFESKNAMRELIIADKQDITRLGIQHLAKDLSSIRFIAFAKSKSNLKSLLLKYPHGVIILDYSNFDFTNFDELILYTQDFPLTNWILFSDTWSDDFLKQVFQDVAFFSVVLKSSTLFEIKKTLEMSLNGKVHLCKEIATKKRGVSSMKTKADSLLTQSEKEVLKEIASGKTTKAIAFERNLSIHTIMTHRKNIFKKLEINNVHDAIRYAIKAGIITRDEYSI